VITDDLLLLFLVFTSACLSASL